MADAPPYRFYNRQIGIYAECWPITTPARNLDSVTLGYGIRLGSVPIAAIRGLIIGAIGRELFSQGESYFTLWGRSFDTKETAFMAKIVLMTVVGIVIGLIIPGVVECYAEYVVLQTAGFVIVPGQFMLHHEISDWRIENERPVITAGGLLAITPLL